jgi:hypothetical protein
MHGAIFTLLSTPSWRGAQLLVVTLFPLGFINGSIKQNCFHVVCFMTRRLQPRNPKFVSSPTFITPT